MLHKCCIQWCILGINSKAICLYSSIKCKEIRTGFLIPPKIYLQFPFPLQCKLEYYTNLWLFWFSKYHWCFNSLWYLWYSLKSCLFLFSFTCAWGESYWLRSCWCNDNNHRVSYLPELHPLDILLHKQASLLENQVSWIFYVHFCILEKAV